MIFDLYQYFINTIHQFFLAHATNAFIFSSIFIYHIFLMKDIFLVNHNDDDEIGYNKGNKEKENDKNILSSASDL
jgi:hypothetical protein